MSRVLLPKPAIEEFKKLYKKRFGVLLSDEKASTLANQFVQFYQTVHQATIEKPSEPPESSES